jgi:predicted transcriptional regulator
VRRRKTRRQAADLSRRVLGTRMEAMATQPTTRDRILEALQGLPADATFDDAIEKLVFLAKIEAGLNELDEGQGVPHAEVKQPLGL